MVSGNYVPEQEEGVWEKAERVAGHIAKAVACVILLWVLLNVDTVSRAIKAAFP